MKATLEYDTSKELTDFRNAINGSSYSSIILEIDTWLKNKRAIDGLININIRDVRDEIRDIAYRHGITINVDE